MGQSCMKKGVNMKFYLHNTDSDGLSIYEDKLEQFNVYKNPEHLDENDIYFDDKKYVIELTSLEELVKLGETVGQHLIILTEAYKDEAFDGAIEIYDYYRE